MICRHQQFELVPFIFLIYLPHTVLSLAPAPAPVDYLMPPPLLQANAADIHFKHASPQNLVVPESRTIQKFINPQMPLKSNDNHPGLMTRVARWFGFANQNAVTDEQFVAGTNKQPYYYQKPQQQQLYGNGDKENCYLCNKHPWVPMMVNSIQFPKASNQWDASKQTQLQTHIQHYPSNSNTEQKVYNDLSGRQQQQNLYGAANIQTPLQIQHASSNVRQRAIKFNFPFPYVPTNLNKGQDTTNHIDYPTGPFLPMPLPPVLGNSALPPLYNAQNFLPSITPIPNTIQELPSTEPAHFAENIGEQSEIHTDTAFPAQVSSTSAPEDSSFEIVKSHQLVDYVSSIEYPASYVPSHSYDVTSTPAPADSQTTSSQINTGFYQHSTFSPHLSQHAPASQILTEIGSFKISNQQESAQHSDAYKHATDYKNQPQFLETVQHYADDNYAAASHRNSSVFEQQRLQQQHYNNLDALTLESNDYSHTTTTPEIFSTREDASTSITEMESATQPQTQDNEIEFIASIQTNAQNTNIEANKSKQRETPKRLLDSPIQHVNGNLGLPRPFTRDPSDLTFRLSPVNHKLPERNQAGFSNETWKPQTITPESATSTFTFSSIDASGQYAGMSPPSLPSTYNNVQSLLPYLATKNRPRPFETTRVNTITNSPSISTHSNWGSKLNLELHTPQESMLVKSQVRPAASATTATTSKPRTTKYLTKILATNLKELLQREHEPTKLKPSPNALDIDINKLQKNIDDWTEQEYTSLSHKPSTPTIRGRSKNIPFEYLPTTMATLKSARQSKTSKDFTATAELPSSINHLEPLYERESTKRYQYTQITDNHLKDFYNSFESMKSKSSTSYKTTTTTPPTISTTIASTTTSTRKTTTSEKTLHLRPIQIQEPEELWKKAKVSISPKTQEKVYVVTPQPLFFPQRFNSPTAAPTTTTTEKSLSSLRLSSGFKSPRFLVRPTPRNDTQSKESSKENINNVNLTREWFGLRGLSTYVPSEPVEIIDGNSKVLNIVTPPSNLETTTRHNIMDLTKNRQIASKRKATMAPSPR